MARRFELVIDGVELANGYFELDDPAEHRLRFAADNAQRIAMGLAEVTADPQFLAAIDHGLPSCAGVALGFDRLFMLQQRATSIASVQAFPWAAR